MTLEELRRNREAILALADKHGVTNIRIFGSIARGEATKLSDVDFIIDIADSSLFHWGGGSFIADLEALLNCKVDLVTEDGLHWYIKEVIMQEAIPL
ncbi:MAG: nucleotidyltransferase domain-containing protein [Anaerolineae bacterium]